MEIQSNLDSVLCTGISCVNDNYIDQPGNYLTLKNQSSFNITDNFNADDLLQYYQSVPDIVNNLIEDIKKEIDAEIKIFEQSLNENTKIDYEFQTKITNANNAQKSLYSKLSNWSNAIYSKTNQVLNLIYLYKKEMANITSKTSNKKIKPELVKAKKNKLQNIISDIQITHNVLLSMINVKNKVFYNGNTSYNASPDFDKIQNLNTTKRNILDALNSKVNDRLSNISYRMTIKNHQLLKISHIDRLYLNRDPPPPQSIPMNIEESEESVGTTKTLLLKFFNFDDLLIVYKLKYTI